MRADLHELLMERYPFLNGLLEPSPGFRVGDWKAVNSQGARAEVEPGKAGCSLTYRSDRVSVGQAIRFHDTGLTIYSTLCNEGSEPFSNIDLLEPLRLAFAIPLCQWQIRYSMGGNPDSFYPPDAYSVRHITKIREPSGLRPFQIESHDGGRSSELYLPLLFGLLGQNESSPGLFCGLEWSGEWYIRISSMPGARSSLSLGIKVNGIVIAPGETLELPAAHIGFYEGGYTAGSNLLRRHIVQVMCPHNPVDCVLPAVSYNHWFGIGKDYDIQLLKRQAERASRLGVEYFVLDSSWFEGDFPEGLGNWDAVNREKFPEGLEPLADFVRRLGMRFGLWFEPERAMPGSHAVAAHPELFVEVHEGKHAGHWTKDYFLLNLALPEARDYVKEMIFEYIRSLDIKWIRWDYNSHFPIKVWEKKDPTGRTQIDYYRGLYELWDDIMSEFPDCLIEQCAGGGRRIDLGTIKRSHAIWISDESTDPFCTRYVQARANCFLPGHLLNSTVEVPIGTGDEGYNDTAILSRMLGKLEISGDIAGWSESLSERMSLWISEYKKIRHLVGQDYFPLLPQPASLQDWDAVLFGSYSGDEALVFAFRGNGGPERLEMVLPQQIFPNGAIRKRRLPDAEWSPLRTTAGCTRSMVVELDRFEGGAWHLLPGC